MSEELTKREIKQKLRFERQLASLIRKAHASPIYYQTAEGLRRIKFLPK